MTPTARQIQDWILARVGTLTELAPEQLDPRGPIARLGLDSVALIALASDLEKWLGYRFRANPLADHPNVESLANFLAEEVARQGQKG